MEDFPPRLLLKRRKPLDDAVPLGDFQNLGVACVLVPEPGRGFFERQSIAKGIHASSIAHRLLG